jgi:putative ABC transport system permease protein
MLELYRTLSLRYLTRRWFRALLIVASIALGVATLVATQSLNDTMFKAGIISVNPLAGFADLLVSNGDLPIARAIGDEIQAIPGVKSVHARVFDSAKIIDHEKAKRTVKVFGFDLKDGSPKGFDDAAKLKLSDGAELAYGVATLLGQTPVIIGVELAKALPESFQTLPVERGQKIHSLTRVGTLEATGDLAFLSGYVLMLDLDAAAKLLGFEPGQVTRLDVLFEPTAKADVVRKAIEAKVAGRALVRTPFEQNESSQSSMAALRTGFSLCGVVALIVGVFLVFNALSVSVEERRHEIGILLSVGATRAQVGLLFGGEAIALGLTGALLGIPLGVGLAYLGLQPMQEILNELFVSVDAQRVDVSANLVMLAIASGVLSTLAATMVPAIQASLERPAEAVRRMPRPTTTFFLALQVLVSMSLIALGTGMILMRASLPPRWGTFGGMGVACTGALLSTPFFARLAAVLLQPFARRYFPIEWRLGADNLLRAPGRTGMVIGALAAGVALVMQTAGTIRSNRLALRDWVKESIGADIIVTAGSLVGAGGTGVAMDPSVGEQLAALPGVEGVLPVRFLKVLWREKQIGMFAFDADRAYPLESARGVKTKEVELYKILEAEKNTTMVSENFAALHRIGKGDVVTLPGPDGPVDFRVVGTIEDYSWNLGTLYIHRRDYVHFWKDTKADVFDLFLKPGADPAKVKETIAARFGVRYDLMPLTRDELQLRIDQMIERVYGIAYGQQVVVMMVAGLGVITSLLISVLQRRREMGLLRAIGAPQSQVIHSVLAEACLMGILGTLIGVLFGVPLQWYVLRVVILEESGFLFPVYIPWNAGILVGIAATLTATLAGLGPAVYAVRQRIPDAIAYE